MLHNSTASFVFHRVQGFGKILTVTTSKSSLSCLKMHTALCARTRSLFLDLITYISHFLFACLPCGTMAISKMKDEEVQTSFCKLLGIGRNYQIRKKIQSNPCPLGGKKLATRSNLPHNRYHLHVWCPFWRGFVAGEKCILHSYSTTTYHCGLEKQ